LLSSTLEEANRRDLQFNVAILYGRLGVERLFFGLLSENVRSKELRTCSSLDTELVTSDCEKSRESRALLWCWHLTSLFVLSHGCIHMWHARPTLTPMVLR